MPPGDKLKSDKVEKYFGVRHIQYVFLFTIMNLAYGTRSILSVTIYEMIAETSENGIPGYPHWANKKNIMLSSFFWGYICFQVFAGQLAKKYGPKKFVGGAAFIGSVFCAAIPYFGSVFDYQGVIICRIITGMTQGFIFPCCHNLISAWSPLQDRAKIGSFVYAGGPLGNVIGMTVAGYIAGSSVGWPMVFYVYGAVGVLWSILWAFYGCDSPTKHKSISLEEKKYIEAEPASDDGGKTMATPWKSIFTSLPFYGILIAHCGQNLGFWTLLTEIPSYMKNILNFDIKTNSTLSSLPYLVNWLLSLIMSPIADYLIVGRGMSVGRSRKIFNTIGLFVPAAALISLGFVGDSQVALAILLLVIAVGFNSAVYSGYNVNHIDLSPVHAGTLMGITNSISNMFSLISPLIIDGIIITTGYQETDKSLWTIVFCMAGGVYLLVGTFYDLVGSGEIQPWNSEPNERTAIVV